MLAKFKNESLYSLTNDLPQAKRLFVTNGVNGDHQALVKLFKKTGFNHKKGDVLISLGNFFGGDSRDAFADNEELSSIAHKDWCYLLLGETEYWLNQAYCAIGSMNQELLDVCINKTGSWLADYISIQKNKSVFSAISKTSAFLSYSQNGVKHGFSSSVPSYSNWSSIKGLLSKEKLVNDLLFNATTIASPAIERITNIDRFYTTGPVATLQRSYNCDVFPESNKNKVIYLLPSVH